VGNLFMGRGENNHLETMVIACLRVEEQT